MIYWVKTQPQADIDHSEYKPFIRNDWFRNHYMFFAYGLMALLTVLFFATGAVKAIRSLLRLPVFVLVFLVHESLHMLVVYRIGDIYLSHSGLFFWMQPHARMSKGRFFLFMTLPLFMLTVVPAVLLLPDTGALRPYLLYIAWSNAIIASSDIINAVLIPLKPNDSVFYRGYYKTGSGAAEKNVSGEPSPCHIETRCADKAENVSGEPSPCHTAVIFVRHAQAVYGSDDRNRPLSEAGMEDRKIVAEALKDRKIDAFLSSPYRRSMETIRPAAELRGMEILTDERFRERKCGDFSSDSLAKRWADFSWAEENGESLRSVQDRNMEALRDVLRNYAGRTVVIGTHGTALSTILNIYNPDFGLQDFLRIVSWMPYITELTFDGDRLSGIKELDHVEKDIPQ